MITTTEFTPSLPTWSTGLRDKGMMLVDYALHPIQTHRWARFLKHDPVLNAVAKIAPHLLTRVNKPYLSPQLSRTDRIDLLTDHYRMVVKAHYGELLRKAAARPQILHELTGKSDVPYQLTLSAIDASRRDGDLTLRLISKGKIIYTASFVFTMIDGLPCMRIGGFQGLLATDRLLRIKQITRDLHGCRPRDMMLHALREIGHSFGCAKLVLIGNGNKLPCAPARVCRKSSDYDQLWKEWHAARRNDGDYEMPCVAASDDDSLAASEPGKRTQLLRELAAALRMRLERERSAGDYALPRPAPDDHAMLPAGKRSMR